MKTEIQKILKNLIQAKGSLCDYCGYSKNSECQNDDNCTYQNSEGFSPNNDFEYAVTDIMDLIEKNPETEMLKEICENIDIDGFTKMDLTPMIHDAANQMEQVISKKETTEISAPLFEFEGEIYNADKIKYVTKIHLYAKNTYRMYIALNNAVHIEVATNEEAQAKRAEFIRLWNANLTRSR